MMYIDKLLSSVIDNSSDINARDLKTLKSLHKLILSGRFISESQGNLLIKLLKNNIEHVNIDISILENPIWSQPFRTVDNTRKLYISNHSTIFNTPTIVAEYLHDPSLLKKIQQVARPLASNIKMSEFELTEDNIYSLVLLLSALNFEIDQTLLNHYETIKSWNEEDVKSQYKLDTFSHPNFQKQITNDLGINTPLNQNIIADRSIRYQYYVEKNENPCTLTEIISNRNDTRLWINSSTYSIDDVIESLIELRRLPVLIVFDTSAIKTLPNNLKLIHDSFVKHDIDSNTVGIYFRLSNSTPQGQEFNQLIGQYGYNSQLDKNTKVAGIESTKLPKFMLKTDWKPMSVISIDHSLRNSKSAIYAAYSDLVITYTSDEPIIEPRSLWE